MGLLLRKIHRVFYLCLISLFFFLLYPLFYYLSRKESRYTALNRLRKIWSSFAFYPSGLIPSVTWEQPIDPKGTYIFCPNHTSYFDIPAMCFVASGPFHFMGKAELLAHPLFSLFFKTIDIPVNRDSKIDAFRAFKRASANLEKGMSIILFPEGMIPDHPPRLGEFKIGAFRLAIEQQIPIVPVTFFNNWKLCADKGSENGTRPGILRTFVHKPIETTGMTDEDADRLKDIVFNLIDKKLKEYENKR